MTWWSLILSYYHYFISFRNQDHQVVKWNNDQWFLSPDIYIYIILYQYYISWYHLMSLDVASHCGRSPQLSPHCRSRPVALQAQLAERRRTPVSSNMAIDIPSFKVGFPNQNQLKPVFIYIYIHNHLYGCSVAMFDYQRLKVVTISRNSHTPSRFLQRKMGCGWYGYGWKQHLFGFHKSCFSKDAVNACKCPWYDVTHPGALSQSLPEGWRSQAEPVPLVQEQDLARSRPRYLMAATPAPLPNW